MEILKEIFVGCENYIMFTTYYFITIIFINIAISNILESIEKGRTIKNISAQNISSYDMKDGDTFIIFHEMVLSSQARERIITEFQKWLNTKYPNSKILLLQENMRIGVIKNKC